MGAIRLSVSAFMSCHFCSQGEYAFLDGAFLPARNAINLVEGDLIVVPHKASCIHPLSTLRRGQNPVFLAVQFYVFGVTVATESTPFHLTYINITSKENSLGKMARHGPVFTAIAELPIGSEMIGPPAS